MSGKIAGGGASPEHIETVMSDVYLFDDVVYKLYKNDNEFFNTNFRDLSRRETRIAFTRSDFAWNHALSPSIYLELQGVSVANDQIRFLAFDDAPEEFLIVMRRIAREHLLFERIVSNGISREDCFSLGSQLADSLTKARTQRFSGYNYFETFKANIVDVHNFIKDVAEYVPFEEVQAYIDFLETFRLNNRSLFESTLSLELDRGGDTHSHNVVVTDGQLLLMDTYPPKDAWLIEHHLLPLYRIGTDIWGLSGNKELFEAFVAGYEETAAIKVDRSLDALFVTYSALIAVSYHYMLQRTDKSKALAATRFHSFLRTYFKEITASAVK